MRIPHGFSALPLSMKIYLIGLMGTGKSHIGRELAGLLRFQFTDLDDLIEERTGRTIPEIFRIEGEADFRRAEAEALRSLAKAQRLIVATGGGTPCFFDNMHHMRENGITVYLQSPVSLLADRLSAKPGQRPLLQKAEVGTRLQERLKELLEKREDCYLKAHLVFRQETGTEPAAREIAGYLKRFIP